MKRFLIFFLCAFGALSSYASNMISDAVTTNDLVEIVNVEYVIDLGDITDLSNEEIDQKLNAVPLYEDDTLNCEVTVKGKIGTSGTGVEVSVTVSGPCDKVIEEANKKLQEMKEVADKFL